MYQVWRTRELHTSRLRLALSDYRGRPNLTKLPSSSRSANSRIDQGLFSTSSMRGMPVLGCLADANVACRLSGVQKPSARRAPRHLYVRVGKSHAMRFSVQSQTFCSAKMRPLSDLIRMRASSVKSKPITARRMDGLSIPFSDFIRSSKVTTCRSPVSKTRRSIGSVPNAAMPTLVL